MATLMEGDPALALRDLALPAGAEVAIVSSDAEVVARIKRGGSVRFGPVRRVFADPRPPSVETAPSEAALFDRGPFEPDARAQAILEGVRIAREDLREAGGATTSNRS